MKLTLASNKTESDSFEGTKASAPALLVLPEGTTEQSREESRACYHCGTSCNTSTFRSGEKSFCCRGCLTVFELLTENGLNDFYQLSETAGVRVRAQAEKEQ